jgi:hypothetical protein
MSSMKMVVMKLENTRRPMAWSPPLVSFPSLVLILTKNSSDIYPSSCGGEFLMNGGRWNDWMWRTSEEGAINRSRRP